MDDALFVGWSSSGGKGDLVATGFAAWGISNGTAAAMILTDLVTGEDNRWTSLFDATRVKPVAGAKAFIKGTSAVAPHMVSGYLSHTPTSFGELAPVEAAIIKFAADNVDLKTLV